jgi:hypothetical protein
MNKTYRANNYNQIAPQVYSDFGNYGVRNESRNGDVLRLPGVTTIQVDKPWQKVIFSPERDANPFFHLMEAMCMLADVNDARFLSFYAKNMLNFSDDGIQFNAFYGTRARRQWGDQLKEVVSILRNDPASRQAVINLWDTADLLKKTKDKACNVMMIFSVDQSSGLLEMTTFNRSNDAIWGGVTGANIVHFPFFQEYVADALQVGVGPWRHVSNNLHIYLQNPKTDVMLSPATIFPDFYETAKRQPMFYKGDADGFDKDLKILVYRMARLVSAQQDWPELQTEYLSPQKVYGDRHLEVSPFLTHTVLGMFDAHLAYVRKDKVGMERFLEFVVDRDWKLAATAWLQRRSS